jgi:transposase-like protein
LDGILSHIEEILEAKKVFERKRKDNKSRALGILLYHYGLSLRKCKDIVSDFEPISHGAVRKWYHKTNTIFSVGRTYGEVIAVDETKVKINGLL